MANETIAIIGATEQLGAILSRRFAKGNYRLLLFSNNLSELKALVKEIKKTSPAADLHSFECLVDASWEADTIVFDVPTRHEQYIAERIRQVATQKVVIRMFHHLQGAPPEKPSDKLIKDATLQQLLPHSKLVEVYLGTDADLQHISNDTPMIAIINGTNIEAAEKVEQIFKNTGFRIAAPEEQINSFHN